MDQLNQIEQANKCKELSYGEVLQSGYSGTGIERSVKDHEVEQNEALDWGGKILQKQERPSQSGAGYQSDLVKQPLDSPNIGLLKTIRKNDT